MCPLSYNGGKYSAFAYIPYVVLFIVFSQLGSMIKINALLQVFTWQMNLPATL